MSEKENSITEKFSNNYVDDVNDYKVFEFDEELDMYNFIKYVSKECPSISGIQFNSVELELINIVRYYPNTRDIQKHVNKYIPLFEIFNINYVQFKDNINSIDDIYSDQMKQEYVENILDKKDENYIETDKIIENGELNEELTREEAKIMVEDVYKYEFLPNIVEADIVKNIVRQSNEKYLDIKYIPNNSVYDDDISDYVSNLILKRVKSLYDDIEPEEIYEKYKNSIYISDDIEDKIENMISKYDIIDIIFSEEGLEEFDIDDDINQIIIKLNSKDKAEDFIKEYRKVSKKPDKYCNLSSHLNDNKVYLLKNKSYNIVDYENYDDYEDYALKLDDSNRNQITFDDYDIDLDKIIEIYKGGVKIGKFDIRGLPDKQLPD